MTDTATTTPHIQQIPPCPSWCGEDHTLEPYGYHHATAKVEVDLAEDPARDADRAAVSLSCYQPFPDDDGNEVSKLPYPEPYPTHVDLRAPINAGSVELTLLSPGEARSLAAALEKAADMAEAAP